MQGLRMGRPEQGGHPGDRCRSPRAYGSAQLSEATPGPALLGLRVSSILVVSFCLSTARIRVSGQKKFVTGARGAGSR